MSIALPDDFPEIPGSEHFQDRPLIQKAKRREIIEKKKHPVTALIEKAKRTHTVKCPDCGCEFDPKIQVRVFRAVDKQAKKMNTLLDQLQGGTR